MSYFNFALVFAVSAVAAFIPGETLIKAAGPLGPLGGVMISPQFDAGEVALIIPGSGPIDRDGNSPPRVNAATYRLIAEGLAQHGIATTRIDKRGMFSSASAIRDANAVTVIDYADDVLTWTATIRKRTGAQCVWVIGHSEGGLVALVAANRASDICGLVLISTPGRTAGNVLREQLSSNPSNAPLLEAAYSVIDELEAGNRVATDNLPPPLKRLFASQVQGYLISLFSYDPEKLVSKYTKPILILQGTKDLQVTEKDALRLSQANDKSVMVVLKDANHMLKPVAGSDRKSNLAAYSNGNLPLTPHVVDSIASFIVEQRQTNSAGRALVSPQLR